MSETTRRPAAVFRGDNGDVAVPMPMDAHEMLERAKQLGISTDEHIWIVFVVHQVADPDADVDMLTLDETTFLGLMSFVCLTCGRDYDPDIRHNQCDQSAPWERGETS